MNEKKRVILISGDNTKWYEQAIFIVRRDVNKNDVPTDFVSEAEKIINEYFKGKKVMPSLPKKRSAKQSAGLDFILNTAMFLSCLLLCVILYKIVGF